MDKPSYNVLAIISAVTGVLGIIGILPFIGSLAAIVTGHLARRDMASSAHPQEGAGLATLGLVTGYLAVFLWCAGIAIGLFIFGGSLLTVVLAAIAGLFMGM